MAHILAACLLAFPLSCAMAQEAPTPLTPSSEATTPQSPSSPMVTSSPSAPLNGPSRETLPDSVSPRAERIQVQDLGTIDPNASGVLDEAHGGFGSDMWAGTSIGIVQKVLPLLPGATTSRSLQRLERKLLLTTAAVPSGKPSGESLVKLRADKLWAMGNVDGLNALLKNLPDSALSPALRRLLVDAALLSGDITTACQQVQALRSQANSDSYPAKVQAFCQFSSGKTNEAGLSVDLLREQKVNDPAFFIAADVLAGIAPSKTESFANPTALTLAMAQAAKLALPESVVAGNLPAALARSIAMMTTASQDARLAAAEKAEAYGVIETESLRQLYEQVTFTTQELSASVEAAATDKGARSRALLFRAAEQQTQPTVKVEIIAKALGLASNGFGYFTAARLYAPQIAELKPTPDLASFAIVAAHALFASGRTDAAAAWIALARAADPSVSAAATGLWPLIRLTSGDSPQAVPPGSLAAWRKALGDLPPATAQRRLLVCFGLLSALADKVPADDWVALYDDSMLTAAAGPSPQTAGPTLRGALWQGLRIATEDLRLGETVMFALATLGNVGLNQADPTDLYRVVAALHLIGLDSDARALAVEAAIANGI
jgi:hypothetical protein